MFKAIGVSLVKLHSGLVQVTVDFFADATPETAILRQAYVVADRSSLNAKVTAQLQALKDAQDEAEQQIDIVGKLLGSI